MNRNSIQEEIKSILKSGNACYHSVQNLLSSGLLCKSLKIKIYRTRILLLFCMGMKHRLRVFKNTVLRRIFGPKRDEVTGEWRKLHNEELNDMYCSPNIIWVIKLRRMKWVGHVVRMGESRGAYRVLVGKRKGKRPLGRLRCRWEDN